MSSKVREILEESFNSKQELIQESPRRDAYMKFFRSKLEKWNINSPMELSDENKSKFFDEISNGWKEEKAEGVPKKEEE